MLCMRGRRKSMYRYFSLVSSLILSASCSSGRMGGASALLKISISSATNSTSPLASLGFAPPVRTRTVPRTPITSSRRNPRALSIRAAALDSIPKTTWARPSLSRRSTKKSPFPCSRYVLIQPQSVTVCPAWDGRSSPQYCVRFSMLISISFGSGMVARRQIIALLGFVGGRNCADHSLHCVRTLWGCARSSRHSRTSSIESRVANCRMGRPSHGSRGRRNDGQNCG